MKVNSIKSADELLRHHGYERISVCDWLKRNYLGMTVSQARIFPDGDGSFLLREISGAIIDGRRVGPGPFKINMEGGVS